MLKGMVQLDTHRGSAVSKIGRLLVQACQSEARGLSQGYRPESCPPSDNAASAGMGNPSRTHPARDGEHADTGTVNAPESIPRSGPVASAQEGRHSCHAQDLVVLMPTDGSAGRNYPPPRQAADSQAQASEQGCRITLTAREVASDWLCTECGARNEDHGPTQCCNVCWAKSARIPPGVEITPL